MCGREDDQDQLFWKVVLVLIAFSKESTKKNERLDHGNDCPIEYSINVDSMFNLGESQGQRK
jgi:hypothetical protein